MRTTIMCKVDKLWGNHVLLVKEIIFPFKKTQTTHSLIGCINLVNIFHLKDVKIFFHDLTWLPLHFSHTGPYSCWGSLVKQASLSSSQWSHYTSFSRCCTFVPCILQIQRGWGGKNVLREGPFLIPCPECRSFSFCSVSFYNKLVIEWGKKKF